MTGIDPYSFGSIYDAVERLDERNRVRLGSTRPIMRRDELANFFGVVIAHEVGHTLMEETAANSFSTHDNSGYGVMATSAGRSQEESDMLFKYWAKGNNVGWSENSKREIRRYLRENPYSDAPEVEYYFPE